MKNSAFPYFSVLFWPLNPRVPRRYLVVEREDDRLSGTFAALHEAFLGQLEVRRPEFRRRLRRQQELIKGLTDLYNDVRQAEKVRGSRTCR